MAPTRYGHEWIPAMSDLIAPHFDLPFRFSDAGTVCVEQGSEDDLVNCVYTIVICPFGWRDEVPTFGIPDQAFSYPAMPEQLQGIIQDQEPRTTLIFSESGDFYDELIRRIRIGVERRRPN